MQMPWITDWRLGLGKYYHPLARQTSSFLSFQRITAGRVFICRLQRLDISGFAYFTITECIHLKLGIKLGL